MTKTAKVRQLLLMGRYNLREISEIAECHLSLVTSIKASMRKAQAGDQLYTKLQRLDQDVRDLRVLVLSRLGELGPLHVSRETFLDSARNPKLRRVS